jgi:heme exporter protein A
VAASTTALWLLDEPLNALDAEGVRSLAELLARHRASGGAVLAASHQPLAGDWRTIELGA